MKEKKLESWADFEKEIQFELLEQEKFIIEGLSYPILFRGHSDSKWHLETTLERFVSPNEGMSSYFFQLERIRGQIETFTQKNWNIPSWQNLQSWLKDENSSMLGIPVLEFMMYLRHHGYPSPLLDWSVSPYVAAYFAFRDTASSAESVAIYSYTQHWVNRLDYSLYERPKIYMIDKNLQADKRHYLQQSVYSLCAKREKDQIFFARHEDVYENIEEQPIEILTKYIIPSTERGKVLRSLEIYNVSAYSLFGTEESLLETMFLHEYVLKWFSDKTLLFNSS